LEYELSLPYRPRPMQPGLLHDIMSTVKKALGCRLQNESTHLFSGGT
jgi:hypothetical protein